MSRSSLFLALLLAASTPYCLSASLTMRTEYSRESSLWKERTLVILGSAAYEGLGKQQTKLLQPFAAELEERKVVVVQANPENEAKSRTLHKLPKGFQVLLFGKDGVIKLKSFFPIKSTRVLTLIDTMPMRVQEMKKANKE